MVKKTKPKKISYKAHVGCWNCDATYEIAVKVGEVTTQYIHDKKILCKECKCSTLKMWKEYKIDNKIMRDIILHDRLEQMEHREKPSKENDYIK